MSHGGALSRVNGAEQHIGLSWISRRACIARY